jgi:formylmethanofuran dehydrogenase subunit E
MGIPDAVLNRELTDMIRGIISVSVFLCAVIVGAAARAETPEEWIALGARVHGGFGAFIPVGIRIGLDAMQRLSAKPREVSVVYYDSDKAPCACVADGVAIATVATLGQRTLMMATEKAPVGAMAVVVVRKKQSEEGFKYRLADSWLPKLAEWNRTLDARGRYDAVMQAEGLFEVTGLK